MQHHNRVFKFCSISIAYVWLDWNQYQIIFEMCIWCLQHNSIDNGNDCGTTRTTHITTKTALRIEFLFSQEGTHQVIMQHEACVPVWMLLYS